jgi:hypothetical protein
MMRRYVFNWGLARMFRFSSENLPFSARHGSGREPIFAAMMAISCAGRNWWPARTAKTLLHEMDLKVAELALSGAAKHSVEVYAPNRKPKPSRWCAGFPVCWVAVGEPRKPENQKTKKPYIYLWFPVPHRASPAVTDINNSGWVSVCAETCLLGTKGQVGTEN